MIVSTSKGILRGDWFCVDYIVPRSDAMKNLVASTESFGMLQMKSKIPMNKSSYSESEWESKYCSLSSLYFSQLTAMKNFDSKDDQEHFRIFDGIVDDARYR